MSLRVMFGRACRDARFRLDLTQAALAAAAGVSRGYIARVELGRVNVTLDVMERIAACLGVRVELLITPPVFLSSPERHDRVHAWCVEMVARRLQTSGWRVAREVAFTDRDAHGWMDLLAFDPATRGLLVIEVKTRLDDLGGLQRQVGWYERHARRVAGTLGWQPSRSAAWVIALASDDAERVIVGQRALFDAVFPGRAAQMLGVVRRTAAIGARGIALVDPASHRADWLIRTRLDGRRSPLRYVGYAEAARRIAR